jgi:uncharacterized protein YndB with AHSA1/START domain
MTRTEYVYVTYIAATPQRIWDAIVQPEFTRQYWAHENLSDWRPGSAWKHRDPETGDIRIVGKIVEATPPTRLVLTWAYPKDENNAAEHSRVTFELEPIDSMVRLTVTHDELELGSNMEQGIKQGWPRVLSSLKTFLETGKPLPTWSKAKAKAQA